jgi:adenylate kinase family enzyme
MIIGSGGAGKSTFARRLGRALGREVVHLDALYWRAGWVEPPKDEWAQRVAELARGESWIIDGNYGGTMDIRLAACDTVIFLDMPRVLCVWRILKRIALYRKGSRPDLPDGCDERIDREFIKYVWNYPRSRRPKILEKLKALSAEKTVVHLRSGKDVEGFLSRLALSGTGLRETARGLTAQDEVLR